MDNEKINLILADLAKEEKIEETLIALYSYLLESGAVSCASLEQRTSFRHDLETLKQDSARHAQILKTMINNYQ
ncbi:MAG: hypothetical protein V1692_00865 [bacterium]